MKLISSWQAPSNIAIVKYWGKYGIQLPCNPSISLTLQQAKTETKVVAQDPDSSQDNLQFFLDGERKPGFEPKIWALLQLLGDEFSVWKTKHLRIYSSNTFPHSAGIASSASGMAALALCLLEIEFAFRGQEIDDSFFPTASRWARLGSGSASRSLFGGFVSWGNAPGLNSNLETAAPLPNPVHSVFQGMKDAILLVDQSEKKVSSTAGHSLMNEHWFAQQRFKQAETHTDQLIQILTDGDVEGFIEVAENEALSLHAMMMTSSSSYVLMRPNTVAIIEEIREFRKQSGLPVCFTLDAGPNVHVLYPAAYEARIQPFVLELVQRYCAGKWLYDAMGAGPTKSITQL